jgi:hypothetical protein
MAVVMPPLGDKVPNRCLKLWSNTDSDDEAHASKGV